jgi:hypothetical protein
VRARAARVIAPQFRRRRLDFLAFLRRLMPHF